MNARSNPRRANGHRRDILRRRVLAAYDVCAICGRPVDKTLRSPHPMSAEVDELIPVSRGGDPLSFKDSLLSGGITRSKKNHGRRLTKLAAQAPPFKAGGEPSFLIRCVGFARIAPPGAAAGWFSRHPVKVGKGMGPPCPHSGMRIRKKRKGASS